MRVKIKAKAAARVFQVIEKQTVKNVFFYISTDHIGTEII
jgi:hypothetical protein